MKKYRVSIILLALSVISFVSFKAIGVEVAPDGTLVEPFFLIGIGSIFFLLSIVSLVVTSILSLIKNKKVA